METVNEYVHVRQFGSFTALPSGEFRLIVERDQGGGTTRIQIWLYKPSPYDMKLERRRLRGFLPRQMRA